MSVAERSVFEESHGPVEIVELRRDVAAFGARFDQIESSAVDGDVRLPILEMGVGTMVQEQRPLQGGVVTDMEDGVRWSNW